MKNQIASTIREIIEPIVEKDGFELVDIEYIKEGGQWFLRVFVDKEGGIDIEDCSKVSEVISKRLDENDPITDAYFLEVSSPGAERPLRNPKDFYKATNEHVFMTTYESIDGMKEFEGKLISYNEEKLVIQLEKKQVELPVDKIASARLAILF